MVSPSGTFDMLTSVFEDAYIPQYKAVSDVQRLSSKVNFTEQKAEESSINFSMTANKMNLNKKKKAAVSSRSYQSEKVWDLIKMSCHRFPTNFESSSSRKLTPERVIPTAIQGKHHSRNSSSPSHSFTNYSPICFQKKYSSSTDTESIHDGSPMKIFKDIERKPDITDDNEYIIEEELLTDMCDLFDDYCEYYPENEIEETCQQYPREGIPINGEGELLSDKIAEEEESSEEDKKDLNHPLVGHKNASLSTTTSVPHKSPALCPKSFFKNFYPVPRIRIEPSPRVRPLKPDLLLGEDEPFVLDANIKKETTARRGQYCDKKNLSLYN